MGRRLRGTLFAILFSVAMIFWIAGPIEPQDVIACDFVNLPEQATAFGKNHIGSINTEGSVSATTVAGMSDYQGRAKWKTGDGETQGTVHGSLWQARNGTVEGIYLRISSPGISQPISIATLNRNGMLDTDRAHAFLFTNRDDKLSHPLSYACKSDQNYQQVYQRLIPSTLILLGGGIILLLLMFLAGRKADRMEF